MAVGTDTRGIDVPADVPAAAAEGQGAMEAILADGASAREQTAALMEALNQSGGSAEAKSAYVVGAVQAVRDSDTLSVKEQDAIIKTALTTDAPTAEGAEQAQQTADKENDNVALGQTEQAMTAPPALDGASTEEPVTGI